MAHDIKQKAYMDGLYVKNFGFKMDFLCLLRTFETVFLLKGYHEGSAEDVVESEKRKLKAAKSKLRSKQKRGFFALFSSPSSYGEGREADS